MSNGASFFSWCVMKQQTARSDNIFLKNPFIFSAFHTYIKPVTKTIS